MRLHYGRYGEFAALANQPGVEFHLRLLEKCALGNVGQWFGWQCRWYNVPSGKALGTTRRKKIADALRKTRDVLPGVTDWVLWTRHPLSKDDQKWFDTLKNTIRLHLWTSADVEIYLSGDATILRGTYFGELILTPNLLEGLHNASVARIRRRWLPEAHQIVDAERILRRMLVESSSWNQLRETREEIERFAGSLDVDPVKRPHALTPVISELKAAAEAFGAALASVQTALSRGDLEVLSQTLLGRPRLDDRVLNRWLQQLRSAQVRAALFATNLGANIRLASTFLGELAGILAARVVAVLAGPGGGKTQLSAQLAAANPERCAGILLHGQDLHATRTLDDLARQITVNGIPIASMEALIAAVDAAGRRSRNRLPILIDGLNEAEDPRMWAAALASLNESLHRYPHVLVVCTVRTEEFADESLPTNVKRLEIRDFGGDTIAAIERYFAFYKINAADADLPMELLSMPLTLRLFCEVTNPTRETVVGIEAMPGSLTALFDRYIEHAAERIAQLAPGTQRYYPRDVRAAINEFGKSLWEKNARSVNEREFRERLGDESRTWDKSLVRALEQEGVILRVSGLTSDAWLGSPRQRREWGIVYDRTSTSEVRIAAIYDALGGHIIGDALVMEAGGGGIKRLVNRPDVMTKLKLESAERHPLGTDVFRALVGLIPRRLYGEQLWQMVAEPVRRLALREAANLEGRYVDNATVTELNALGATSNEEARHIFTRLRHTRGAESHPLNADFLNAVLRPMTMPTRDLIWSEWVRRNRDELLSDLEWIETRWREQTERYSSSRLRATWIMWLLTSTVRSLRDHATRALYWFGRRAPEVFFEMTLGSLAINDPYVPERMLAAAYGIAMALHRRALPAFRRDILPQFAGRLFEEMFGEGALHATTHALRRDYARHTINLALLHHPRLLSSNERRRVYPPFPGVAKRSWGKIEKKYAGGSYGPIRMDFGNYTIGRLVEARGNYQYDHAEYQAVVQSILWRIYDLGFNDELFERIDRQIGEEEWRYGRTANGRKVDRYGKKYSWIAFFEMAGERLDEGQLRAWYGENGRLSDIDIDPSFPGPVAKGAPVLPSLQNTASLQRWLQRRDVPRIRSLLRQEELRGNSGPWVLLDGYFHQRDGNRRIGVRCHLRNVLVPALLFPQLKKELAKCRSFNDLHVVNPAFHYTFVGEAGWADTYPACGTVELSFQVGSRTVRRQRSPLDNLLARMEVDREEAGSETARDQPSRYITFEQPIYNKIKVLLPVVANDWESYHSAANSAELPPLLGREVCSTLRLYVEPETNEFYDLRGQLASVIMADKSAAGTSHEFVYLRKDLYDTLLTRRRMQSLWLVWGERELDTRNIDELPKLYEKYGSPRGFQTAIRYPPCVAR